MFSRKPSRNLKPVPAAVELLRQREAEGFSSLYEVATMIASQLDVREILETVVEAAKKLSGSEKTVLCLVDRESSPPTIDAGTLLVRGRRSKYPESWWRALIDRVGPEVLETGVPRDIRDDLCVSKPRPGVGCLFCLPLAVEKRTVGLLVAVTPCDRPLGEHTRSVLTILSSFAAVALESARLVAQSKQALLEGERRRIAREMHDGLAQSLFSLSLNLEICIKQMKTDPDGTRARLIRLQQIASSDLKALRDYIYDLRPEETAPAGLLGAIGSHFRDRLLGHPIGFRLDVYGRERSLDYSVEQAALRIVQEAAANAVKHSGAGSLRVKVGFGPRNLIVTVEDDGKGFEVPSTLARCRGRSFGLLGMRERAREVSGKLSIRSTPGGGAVVRAVFPAEREGENRCV